MKTNGALHCHDISDRVWKALAERLPGQRGRWDGVARDNRLFINAVIRVFRTGTPWRDLPCDFGDWKNTHPLRQTPKIPPLHRLPALRFALG